MALDVSDSMRAEDVAPSRLERAKLAVERVVAERGGDRVGLVVFAGEAFLQCPLTTDRGALRLFLDAADPEMVGVQGTDFSSALRVADRAFDAAAEGAAARPRALLVVSDGEDHEGGLGGAADALRDDGVTILALGVGTDEGATIPEVRRGRRVGVHRDRSGAEVVSRYEPGALRDLAGRADVFRVGRGGTAAAEVSAALDGLDPGRPLGGRGGGLGRAVPVAARARRAVPPRRAPPRPPPGGARGGGAARRGGAGMTGVRDRRRAVPAAASGRGGVRSVHATPPVRLPAILPSLRSGEGGPSGRPLSGGGAGAMGTRTGGASGGAGRSDGHSRPAPAPLATSPLPGGEGEGAGRRLGLQATTPHARPPARRTLPRPALVLVAAVLLGGCTDAVAGLQPGVSDGRAGVALLDAGDPEGAEAAFVAGLAADDVPRAVQARLWHSLGIVRARRKAVAEADSAFAEAILRADDPDLRARYATDAGTAALLGDDPARAVEHLRRALVLDPTDPAARRNVEIALRRLADDDDLQPTPFAERVKARADSLVAARQYPAALDVMEDGLRQDSSVSVYADFVGRLTGVVDIETGGAAAVDSAP